MRRFLARAVVLLLVCGVVAVAVKAGEDDDATSGPSTSATAADEATLTGFATGVEAEVRVVDTVGTPFTVEVPDAGGGSATVEAALVDGRRTSLVWDGGEPLTLTGEADGGLDVGALRVTLSDDGEMLALDGAPRRVLPGRYRTAATVALATGGLATSRDGVTFTADERTRLVTRGGASITLARRPVLLDGPGRLTATGRLAVRRRGGTTAAGRITFGPGAYRLELVPSGNGYRVAGTLRGRVSTA